MTTKTVRVDKEVYTAIVKQGTAADTINSVLRRLLKLEEKKAAEKVRHGSV